MDPRFIAALKTCLQLETQIMRGYQNCEFCDAKFPIMVESKGERCVLGHGEIHVQATDGTIFAAPTLVVHYVEAHRYEPPAEFMDAVMWLADKLGARDGALPTAARFAAADIVARTRLPWVESLSTLEPGQDSWVNILRFDDGLKALVVTATRTWAWTSPASHGAVRLNRLQPPEGIGALPFLELEPEEVVVRLADAASALREPADDLLFALPFADLVATAFATGTDRWIERSLRWIDAIPWMFLPVETMRTVVRDTRTDRSIRRRIQEILSLPATR